MKAPIEEVQAQLKEVLGLESTFIEENRALLVRSEKPACLVLWFSVPEPGIFNTDELEESCSINKHTDEDTGFTRMNTWSIDHFDVETMEEFLEKVKESLAKI
jgi:hypothetical protein